LKDKQKKRVQKLGSAEKIFASNPLRHTIQKIHTDLSTIIVDKISMQNISRRKYNATLRQAQGVPWNLEHLGTFFLESARIK
jgi:hypothetical protein